MKSHAKLLVSAVIGLGVVLPFSAHGGFAQPAQSQAQKAQEEGQVAIIAAELLSAEDLAAVRMVVVKHSDVLPRVIARGFGVAISFATPEQKKLLQRGFAQFVASYPDQQGALTAEMQASKQKADREEKNPTVLRGSSGADGKVPESVRQNDKNNPGNGGRGNGVGNGGGNGNGNGNGVGGGGGGEEDDGTGGSGGGLAGLSE